MAKKMKEKTKSGRKKFVIKFEGSKKFINSVKKVFGKK